MARSGTLPGDTRRPPRQAICLCTVTPRPATRRSAHPRHRRGLSTAATLCYPNAPAKPPARHRAHKHEKRRHLDSLPLQPQTAPRGSTTRECHSVVAHHPARDRVRCGTRRRRPPAVVLPHPLTAARAAKTCKCHRVVAHNPARDRGSCSTRSPVALSRCRCSCKPPRAPRRPASATTSPYTTRPATLADAAHAAPDPEQEHHRGRSAPARPLVSTTGGPRGRPPRSAGCSTRLTSPVAARASRSSPAAAAQKPAEECHGGTTAPAGPVRARHGLQHRHHSLLPLSR